MSVFNGYCLCGGSMRASGSLDLVDGIAKAFNDLHRGDGHGPTTARKAGSVRLRNRAEQASVSTQEETKGETDG